MCLCVLLAARSGKVARSALDTVFNDYVLAREICQSFGPVSQRIRW